MRMSEISFCNKKALNIRSDKFKSFLLSNIREQYNISITDRNAYILNKRSIKNLSKNPHFISLKTSGTNYYLFFTRINEKEYCFFIDKKIKNGYTYPRILSVKYNFSKDVFNDTLLEGELVRCNDNSWLYIIFDIRCYKGINQKKVKMTNKIQNIYSLFDNYDRDKATEVCELQVKRFFDYNEFDMIINEFIPKLNYRVNGLFFNTLNTHHHNYLYFFPRDGKIVKKKVKNDHTGTTIHITENVNKNKMNVLHKIEDKDTTNCCVFVIKKTDKPDVYHLYCVKNNHLVKYSIACVPTLHCSKFIRSIFINNNKDIDLKISCEFNTRFSKWQPKCISNVFYPDSFESIKQVEEKISKASI